MDFEQTSDYIITRKELCNHLVAVTTDISKLVGFPICIEGSQYPRNALMFNLTWVFPAGVDAASYASIVRKAAHILRDLEASTHLFR